MTGRDPHQQLLRSFVQRHQAADDNRERNTMFDRKPDLVVTSDDLIAEGTLIDPTPWGQTYVKWGDRPINRWTHSVLTLLRDYFASGKTPVPFWGVLADVLHEIVTHHHVPDPDGSNYPPFAFEVPAFEFDPEIAEEDPDHTGRPDGAVIWLEPNDVDGWTALLPEEH